MDIDPGLMRRYVSECLRATPHGQVTAADLYAHYVRWAQSTDLPGQFVATKAAFGRYLKGAGVQWRRTSAAVVYLGVEPVSP